MGTLRSIDRPELPLLIAGIGSLLEEVHENLFAPEYDSLVCRLEFAHATAEAAMVEARRRVRFDEAESGERVSCRRAAIDGMKLPCPVSVRTKRSQL